MRIAYLANPNSIHDAKWINYFGRKYDVIVLSSTEDTSNSKIDKSIPVINDIPKIFPVLKFWDKRKGVKILKEILDKHQIDIVHTMYAIPNALWVQLSGFKNHIITTRGSDILVDYLQTFHQRNSLIRRFQNWYLRNLTIEALLNAKFITSTSLRQQKEIMKLVPENKNCLLIRTGIDTGKYLTDVKDKFPGSEKVIFCPRSMLPVYNLEVIVDAAQILKNSEVEGIFKFRLLNDKPDHDYADFISKKVREAKLDNIIEFLPVQDPEGMIRLYSESDIVIMVPTSDGTPNTALEAMLSKKPLIMGALPYDEDLFNDNTIWKLKQTTPEALAEEIRKLISLPEDELKQKTGNAFNNALKLVDLQEQLEKVDQLYQRMVR